MQTRLPRGWRDEALGSFCEQFKRTNGARTDLEPLSVTKANGIVLQSTKFKKRIATAADNYKVLQRGEFAYDPMSLYYGAIGQLDCVEEGVVSPAYITFDLREKDVDRRWFRHLVHSDLAQAAFTANTEGGNLHGKRKKTDWAAFSSVRLPLPPLPEQRKIAEILGSVDEAIRAMEAVIDQTRKVKEGLLQELLTKGIGHTKFKKTEIGEIPVGWTLGKLGDIANIVRGSTPRPARDPKFFDGSFMPWVTVGLLPKDDSPFLDKTPTCLTEAGAERSRILPKGTVVLSNSGYGCGVPKVLRIEACANDGIAAFLDLKPEILPLYLYFYLFSKTMWLRTEVARGVDQPNLNTDLIRAVPLPIPPIEEQGSIVQAMLEMTVCLDGASASLAQMRTIKQGLLQDLLSGKVRVKV